MTGRNRPEDDIGCYEPNRSFALLSVTNLVCNPLSRGSRDQNMSHLPLYLAEPSTGYITKIEYHLSACKHYDRINIPH